MASMPGDRHVMAPASPASGHDTDTPGTFQRGKRKYSHTTAAQRQCLIEWLELPGNFELLTKPMSTKVNEGNSTSSPPPKRLKKTDGYRSLAEYMNRVALTEWTEKTARSRFESFMTGYRNAKRLNLPDLLPRLYQRVDALFLSEGNREIRFRSESMGQRSEGSRSPLLRENETVFHVLTPEARTILTEGQTSPSRQRTRTNPAFESTTVTMGESVDEPEPASSPLQELTSASMSDQALKLGTSVAAPEARTLLTEEQTSPSRQRARTNRAFESTTVTIGETVDEASSPLQEFTSAPMSDQALKLASQRLAVRQQELELKQSELRARQEENRQKLRAEVLTKLVESGKSPAEVREYLAIMDPVDNRR